MGLSGKPPRRLRRPPRPLLIALALLISTFTLLTQSPTDRPPSVSRTARGAAPCPVSVRPDPDPDPDARFVADRVTIGVKTFACDRSVVRMLVDLLHTVRHRYPTVRVLLANDGPLALAAHPFVAEDPHTTEIHLPPDSGISAGRNAMVRATATPFFLLLDDDHVFTVETDLARLVRSAAARHPHPPWDIVGMRVRNLQGIPELENANIFIPRYIANITKFENRDLTLCVWNENIGPAVAHMRTPVRVHVLHNALLARTASLTAHPWRDQLKVNEHMSFFLDAWKANLRVGYLPSVYVHHRPRAHSKCYEHVRRRENLFEHLLDYRDKFLWEEGCYKRFPEYVAAHMETQPSP